jgi:hypothetical protein
VPCGGAAHTLRPAEKCGDRMMPPPCARCWTRTPRMPHPRRRSPDTECLRLPTGSARRRAGRASAGLRQHHRRRPCGRPTCREPPRALVRTKAIVARRLESLQHHSQMICPSISRPAPPGSASPLTLAYIRSC